MPKDNGSDVRLILHLSYPKRGASVNSETPTELCSVSYPEFDEAIKLCLREGRGCKIARSDMKSAFCGLGIMLEHWPLLLMRAKSPLDGQWYWIVDKCLPFGSSRSCAHFQEFSNSVAHIVSFYTHRDNVNYLDDYLFAALVKTICDDQVEVFLRICHEINFPVNFDKTFWGTTVLTFLGLLINTVRLIVCVPIDKVQRATTIIQNLLSKKKATVHQIQKACEFLNFLCRAVIPGRAFTRCMYAYCSGNGPNKSSTGRKLLPHHHVNITIEMRSDLHLWLVFLSHPSIYCRPFIDFDDPEYQELEFYSDPSRNFSLGFGGYCGNSWMMQHWDQFTEHVQPSIGYLELYAAVAAILAWINRFRNKHTKIFVDNQSVMHMVNNTTGGCKNCMVLIRIMVLECMYHNISIKAEYVKSADNSIADALSRADWKSFNRLTKEKSMDSKSTPVPETIWPIKKIWLK